MRKEVKLNLINSGHCVNYEKMVCRSKPFKKTKFHAVFGLIQHPQMGPVLFDTGYSGHLVSICQRFPYSLYSLITPIYFHEPMSASNQIERYGYKPENIEHIIISHFHPDHISGLKDFPNARYYGCTEAYNQLCKLSKLSSLKELFFKELLPVDFDKRFFSFESSEITTPYEPFDTGFDIFGDQSIIGVRLPGHARGQIGVFLRTQSTTVLLAADACWQRDNYLFLDYPHFLGRLAIHDYPSFCQTLHKLQQLKLKHPDIEIIPTHCEEMWYRYIKEPQPC